MTITTYNYINDYQAEINEENVTLQNAVKLLKKEEIHFFHIEDEKSFLEITLSAKNEIITNGYSEK